MRNAKEKFVQSYETMKKEAGVSKIVVAIKLPTQAVEIIINDTDIAGKMEYYIDNYDSKLALRHNDKVRIISYMFVPREVSI